MLSISQSRHPIFCFRSSVMQDSHQDFAARKHLEKKGDSHEVTEESYNTAPCLPEGGCKETKEDPAWSHDCLSQVYPPSLIPGNITPGECFSVISDHQIAGNL